MAKYNILIIDDHPSVRMGLKAILKTKPKYEVIDESGSFEDGFKKALELPVDIILMDVSIHGTSGIELTHKILEKKPELKIIMISMYARTEYIIRAIEYGAKGYILKDSDNSILLDGIESVINGELFIDNHISNKVISKLMNKDIKTLEPLEMNDYKKLSMREQEILYLLVEGVSSKDIAKQLFISTKTVETHKASIMNKLNCKNLVELVRYAILIGLID
ncbi:MAG: response regulator transcription factor [Spirochaetia bacterium]|nr:response regulator transcription factor [Spirochaetia bacterium]